MLIPGRHRFSSEAPRLCPSPPGLRSWIPAQVRLSLLQVYGHQGVEAGAALARVRPRRCGGPRL